MADISFYKYLEAAFRYRLFNPAGQRASLQTKFNALGYNLPYERIFYYARRLLPKFYTSESPDTEEGNLQMAKKVLEKLDKHQDTELENQFKVVTVSEENAQVIADAQAESQQAEVQQAQSVEAAGRPSGMPGLPSAPSISSAPRAPRIVISHTPDQPFQGPGQGTAATSKIRGIQEKAEIERVGAATAKANRLTAQTTTLRAETQLASSGNLNPSTVSGSSSPTPPKFNWRGFRMPASFTNAAKNFGSESQRFIGTNLGRMGRGLGEIAGGVGRGIAGPALTGTYNLLGKAANGGLNAFERLSSPSLRGASRSFMSSGSKKMAWGLVGALVFFVIGAGLIGGLTGGGTSGQTGNVGIGTTAAIISPTGTQPRPAAPIIDPSGLRQAIIEKFGITMNGYDNDHLKWAWDKFWDVSNSNFISFVRGSVITIDSDSRQVGCPGEPTAVYLSQYPEGLFKYALTHELGHVIKNCLNSSANLVSDFFNAFNKERGVTYYANNASICTGSDNQSEDYAEMVALYLNPNANIQMTRCATDAGVTKYTNLKTDFPLHYNVARSVLGDY